MIASLKVPVSFFKGPYISVIICTYKRECIIDVQYIFPFGYVLLIKYITSSV